MKNPKVFIIVLHYKNWEDTNECLKSLEDLNYDNFEIIVIDNDKDNKGFAGGNNIGIKQALGKSANPEKSHAMANKANYILLLNNDTVIKPNFLKELIKVGESDKNIGILGPVIYEYGTSKIHFAGGKINWLYTKGTHISTISTNPAVAGGQPSTVDYITGACLLIKREVIEKIGLMDEDYFLYFEDVDWCLKAQNAGCKCVLVPTSKIWHKVSQGTKEGSFSYIYYHTRNGLLMAKKNAKFFIKVLVYLQSFWIFGKQIIKLLFFPKKRIWAKAIMRGIRDFYKGKVGKLNR